MRTRADELRDMRVAYFAGTLKPGHDGVTRVLYRLIDALKFEKITSVFYSPIVPSVGECPVPMVEVPSVSVPVYREYRFALPGQRHFEDHLSEFRPDLIHINSPCPLGYAAIRYGRDHGVPVVATYHTHFPSYARYYKVRSLELLSWNYLRGLYNHCQRVYVPSQPILQELSARGLRNLRYLPHGVDTATFHPGHRSRAWKERLRLQGKSVLLFAGRLVWEKDLQVLADAYSLLSDARNDIAFVIAGDGPIRSDLEELMPRATFLGMLSGRELSEAYASSDLFVFPSTTETFGNVVLEAMASGIIPICSRQGGPAGIIQHGVSGMLTEPRDPRDFAEKVTFLLDNPGRRAELTDRALQYARTQTWDYVFREMFADYEDVLQAYEARQRKGTRKAA
jgi:phosphatidylinositol alpha 1,6-mannosyltransferase